MRKVFSKLMDVKGMCTTLHAEVLPTPMPYLRTESAPFRIVIRGEVKNWIVKNMEDLRTYTDAQLREKKFCEDWVIAIFGTSPKDKDFWQIDRVRGLAVRHHVLPRTGLFTPREAEGPMMLEDLSSSRTTIAQPYDKPGPQVVIKDEWTTKDSSRAALEEGRWTGTTEFQIMMKEEDEPIEGDPVIREAARKEAELDGEESTTGTSPSPKTRKPSRLQ